ncbi:S16 family serine protease [Streptomyces sp. NPDC002133]|uniref:S16 family serine protease n=1 Tax=Streptomyces sp. NPDC002133 TaxID=3154409 RepID=UPI00332881BF
MLLSRLSRPWALLVCALPVVALLAVAGLAPLPFALAQPGQTTNVLGVDHGKPVITISGAPTRKTDGALRMTTILATGPAVDVGLGDVVDAWFRTDRAVLPHDAVYPSGQSDEQIEKHNVAEMKKSQVSAVDAALDYLDEDPAKVKVTLHLADVGGPSAGLLFSLGIVDKLEGNGTGGDLTGGRDIAGTGTITAEGKIGAVGGVSLKTQAAARDGATVFLVPKAECTDAQAELPEGMRLIPVSTLKEAVDALRLLDNDESKVPTC